MAGFSPVGKLFTWFEGLVDAFRAHPIEQPPRDLLGFYWYFVRQIWPFFAVVLVTGLLAAIVEIALITFVGQIIDMVKSTTDPARFFAEHGRTLLGMAVVALLLRPAIFGLHNMIIEQAIAPSFTNMVRWQTHRYVLRQSLSFFQNDYPGRIANRIMQTGDALRASVLQSVDILWFVIIYAVGALVLFVQMGPLLALPLLFWVACYLALLAWFVPQIRACSARASEARSALMGQVVDSYTNIMTLKLFAQADHEDEHARAALARTIRGFQALTRRVTMLEILVWLLSGLLMTVTLALALWLWRWGEISVGEIAIIAGLIIRINNMSGWIMNVVTNVFEDIGTVEEGLKTIARPHQVVDRPGARALVVRKGEISFERVRFHYGQGRGVIEDLSLHIAAGEKVGLVGPSGAGKSTLVHLLLRFYDLEGGTIRIDGQDIAQVTQHSLRAQIGMVTQDTSLLHRSVLDNIRYGRPDASLALAMEAARQARSDAFIQTLVDQHDRRGYHAHVGDRGVKLSGGQRQRIAIARVLLKDAPILVLDEATSALDSEVEAAIQQQLVTLMAGKTVIAIAHRLSTIAAMDRLVVMQAGRIVEDGSHDALLARGGLYAGLWARQSGGFLLGADAAPGTDAPAGANMEAKG